MTKAKNGVMIPPACEGENLSQEESNMKRRNANMMMCEMCMAMMSMCMFQCAQKVGRFPETV